MIVASFSCPIAGSVSAAEQSDPKPDSKLEAVENSAAVEYAKTVWQREKLTGNWNGLRPILIDHGVDIEVRLSHYYQGVASGGVDKNWESGGKVDYLLTLDGHKLGLWPGFFVGVHAESQWGDTIGGDAGELTFPNTQMLYPAPDYDGTSLTGLTFTQALSEDFVLFAGKLNSVDMWTMFYPNVGGGYEGFMNVNVLASALPWFRFVNLSELGGGAFTLDEGRVQAGVLAFDTNNSSTNSGFDDLFDDGVAGLAFYRFFFEMDEKPGGLLFAVGGSTRKYGSLEETDWHFVPGQGLDVGKKRGAWATAVYFDQVFWQAAENTSRNAYVYTGWTIGDDDPSFGRWAGFIALEGVGVFESRAADRMGFAWYYSGLSNEFEDLVDDIGVRLRDTWGFEAYYNVELAQWLHVTGDVQVLENEFKGDDTALVLGVRTVVDF
jgi:porin